MMFSHRIVIAVVVAVIVIAIAIPLVITRLTISQPVQKVLVVGTTYDPKTLDPAQAYDIASASYSYTEYL